jgi:hypothetical protein
MITQAFITSHMVSWFHVLEGDNPQVHGIDVTSINVEVMGIRSQNQEGKAIHNFSYLCTKQNIETCVIDLMIESNKVIKGKGTQRCPNPQLWRAYD